jgi:flagellin-like hook-associated protein FlgL
MVNNVGTFAQNDLLRRRMIEIQAEVNRLQVQVSSGKKSDAYSGLGGGARLSLNLRATKATTQSFIDANVVTRTRMEQMQNVLGRIKDIASDVRATTLTAISSASLPTATGNAALKAQAQSAIKEIVQLLNTEIDGFHLFAGRITDAAPMTSPGEIGVAGTPLDNAALVAAVSPLGATAASGDTVYDNIVLHLDGNLVGAVPGASPVRYYNGEFNAADDSLIIARVDDDFDLDYGVTGRNDGFNDVLQALYALATADLTAATDGGFRQLATRAAADLAAGFDGVVSEIGALGVKQVQLQDLTTRQHDFLTTLELQIGDVEDVDMAGAISQLTFTQTSLEASFRMVASMRELSLARLL